MERAAVADEGFVAAVGVHDRDVLAAGLFPAHVVGERELRAERTGLIHPVAVEGSGHRNCRAHGRKGDIDHGVGVVADRKVHAVDVPAVAVATQATRRARAEGS